MSANAPDRRKLLASQSIVVCEQHLRAESPRSRGARPTERRRVKAHRVAQAAVNIGAPSKGLNSATRPLFNKSLDGLTDMMSRNFGNAAEFDLIRREQAHRFTKTAPPT